MGIFVYLRASRLPFLTGSLFPVAAATALAYVTDHTWNFLFFGLTMLGVAALHLGANLINDYYDSFGSDPLNRNFTPFSGGSRVIQNRADEPGAGQVPGLPAVGPGSGMRPQPDLPGTSLGGPGGPAGFGRGLVLFRLAAPAHERRPGGAHHFPGLRAAPHLGGLLRPDGETQPGGGCRQPAPGLPHHRHHLDQRVSRSGGGPGRGQAPPGGPPGAEACPAGSMPP